MLILFSQFITFCRKELFKYLIIMWKYKGFKIHIFMSIASEIYKIIFCTKINLKIG